jgi:hypothetical protein
MKTTVTYPGSKERVNKPWIPSYQEPRHSFPNVDSKKKLEDLERKVK